MLALSLIYSSILLLGPVPGVLATPLEPSVGLSIIRAETELEGRDWTDCVDTAFRVIAVVDKYPQYKSEFKAWGTAALGGVGTMSLCKTFRVNAIDCNYAGLTMSSALGIAVNQGFIAPGATKDTQGAVDAVPKDELRRHMKRLPARLEAYLLGRGLSFDSITPVPIQKRDETGFVSHVVEVRGLRDGNETDVVTTDLRINTREDGAANIQILPSGDALPEKRSGALGFKISYKVSNGSGQPREAIYKELCDKVAKHWADTAKSKGDMVDYLGEMHFDAFGDMGFRIHPEVSYYDLKYEDVNQCQGR
ncbi:hypothetical protein F4820DRAFT_449148 [Hypoxylon rubiginosum]|uniref:Uncharacterized protein n=1 Tax=Hypoxylon rubiginosum TaxID=110542 RepID=A0ACB9YY19_9PEZI|nr:hypothetical protein F4820DRAFT_449148 [Hypoxylon rubiginosum]